MPHSSRLTPYLYVLPLVALLAFVFGYPLVRIFEFSFKLVRGIDGPWIGFRNYELILGQDLFWESVRHNLFLLMQRLEGHTETLREPLLDRRGDHLEIAGIEDDARGIAMLEAHLLRQGEIAQGLARCFKRKRWTLPVCVFGSASMKTTERGYL